MPFLLSSVVPPVCAPFFDVDELVLLVTTSEGAVRQIRPADVQAIYERRPRWPVYAGLSMPTVVLGAVTSALVVPLLSPLTAAHGALLGGLGGALAAALLPWLLPTLSPFAYARLLERLGPFAYWRAVFPKADA